MLELIKAIKIIKEKFEAKHLIKNCEGKPFFGEITIIINDGKIDRIKGVTEIVKL